MLISDKAVEYREAATVEIATRFQVEDENDFTVDSLQARIEMGSACDVYVAVDSQHPIPFTETG